MVQLANIQSIAKTVYKWPLVSGQLHLLTIAEQIHCNSDWSVLSPSDLLPRPICLWSSSLFFRTAVSDQSAIFCLGKSPASRSTEQSSLWKKKSPTELAPVLILGAWLQTNPLSALPSFIALATAYCTADIKEKMLNWRKNAELVLVWDQTVFEQYSSWSIAAIG